MSDGWIDVTRAGGSAWEALEPGLTLAQALDAVDPGVLDDSARVSYLQATDRLAGWVHMMQARALVAVSDAVKSATASETGGFSSHQQSWVADEVAAALHIAPRTATARVNAAHAVLRDWPVLGIQVAAGRLTVAQAREIYEAASLLSGTQDADGVDLSERAVSQALAFAGGLPPARLRERMGRLVASLDPAAAAKRRKRAERDFTDVHLYAEPDGIACLAARGPAVDLSVMHQIIDRRARRLRDSATEGDDRTLGQWRHAALLAAFGLAPVGAAAVPALSVAEPSVAAPSVAPDTGGSSAPVACGLTATLPASPVDVQIRVTVSLETLLGLTDSPGELEGYGSLDAELVRALAGDADWVRWVTDPVGDYLLDEGRRRFPGSRLRRFLHSREARCKHPACGVRSKNCDADHLTPYAEGGHTAAHAMSPTCPRHNRHREASGWQVHDEGPRDPSTPPDPTWTSPLGRRYQTV
ncbi:MAG: DUF222 domain-containing protein, partial [Candidatus Nanopelagicales bacterium]